MKVYVTVSIEVEDDTPAEVVAKEATSFLSEHFMFSDVELADWEVA